MGEWRRRSQMRDAYCCVHNADCPHMEDEDPLVMSVSWRRWVCPTAIIELSEHEEAARNNLRDDAPRVQLYEHFDLDERDLIRSQLDSEELKDNLMNPTLEQLDGMVHEVEDDELSQRLEELWGDEVDAWEEAANA